MGWGDDKGVLVLYTDEWCNPWDEKVDVVSMRCTFNVDEELKVFDVPIS